MDLNQNKSTDYSDLEEILTTGRLRRTYEAFGFVFELQTLLKSEEKLISSISGRLKQTYFYMYHALQFSLVSINLVPVSIQDRRRFRSTVQPIVIETLFYLFYDLNMKYLKACELFSEYQLSDLAQYKFKVIKEIGLQLPVSEFRDVHWAWYYYHSLKEEKRDRWQDQDNTLYTVAATSSDLAKILRKEFVQERQKFEQQFNEIYSNKSTANTAKIDLTENLRVHETESQVTAYRYNSEFEKALGEELQGEHLELTRDEYEQLQSMGIKVDNVRIVESPMLRAEEQGEFENFPHEWVEEYQEE